MFQIEFLCLLMTGANKDDPEIKDNKLFRALIELYQTNPEANSLQVIEENQR